MDIYDYEKNPQGVAEVRSLKRDDNLRRTIEVINNKLQSKEIVKVLELGCGGGRNLLFLKKMYGSKIALYGSDISSISIDHAKQTIEGSFFVAPTTTDCFGEKFDVVLLLDILEHLPSKNDVEKTLALVKTKIESDGTVLISCPLEMNRYSIMWFFRKIHFWSDLTLKYYGHTLQFTSDELVYLVRQSFVIHGMQYSVHCISQLDTLLFFYIPKQILSVFGEKTVTQFRESSITINTSQKQSVVKSVIWSLYSLMRYPSLWAGYIESRIRRNSRFGAMNVRIECS